MRLISRLPALPRSTGVLLLVLTLLSVGPTACGGGGSSGGEGDGLATLSGKAVYPDGLPAASGPVANSNFQVLDLSKAAEERNVATGQTTEEGDYVAAVDQSKVLVVIVNGQVRVSGLLSVDTPGEDDIEVTKNFNAITDVACEAGVSSVLDGSVSPEEYSSQRIANLEAAAALVLSQGGVDFSDPASVTAAAMLVRELTNDGARPPVIE